MKTLMTEAADKREDVKDRMTPAGMRAHMAGMTRSDLRRCIEMMQAELKRRG